jgi:hypothetical protein
LEDVPVIKTLRYKGDEVIQTLEINGLFLEDFIKRQLLVDLPDEVLVLLLQRPFLRSLLDTSFGSQVKVHFG